MSFDLNSSSIGQSGNGTVVLLPAEWYIVHNGVSSHSLISTGVLLLLSILLLLYDGFTRKRMDSLWSLLVGAVVWTVALGIVSPSTGREYALRHYGFHFVIALFLGDRAFDCLKGKQKRPFPWRRWVECCVLAILVLLFEAYEIGFYRKSERIVGDPSVDRVSISSLSHVLLFIISSVLSVSLLLLWRGHRYVFRRAVGVCSFSFLYSLVEILGAYWANQYWVELGSFPDWIVLPSNGLVTIAVIYDILFERVFPNVFSYLLMVLFCVLRDYHQDSYYSLPVCKDHVLFPVSSFFCVCCTSCFSVFVASTQSVSCRKHARSIGVGSYGWICRLSFREPKCLLIFCAFGSTFR